MSARQRRRKRQSHHNGKDRKSKRPQSRIRTKITNADWLTTLRQWLLPNDGIKDGIFAHLKRHGNSGLGLNWLVWLALCWGWSGEKNVTDAFTQASDQCRLLRLPCYGSYQGFMKALVRWTTPLLPILWTVLQERMRQIDERRSSRWKVHGWIPIAFDGSRNTAPRSVSAEQAYCASNYGKGKTALYRRKKSQGMRRTKNEGNKPQPQEPQVWITLMWHMGLRLPWMWRLGPSNSSERLHVAQMLQTAKFPENTLFTGDAGFVGYPLWSQILEGGHDFLVRVGGNTNFLVEQGVIQQGVIQQGVIQQGIQTPRQGIVWCWPKEAQQARLPALRLRLERIKIGKTGVWMLTSVLDRSQLNKAQMVQFYKMRWGIEIEFRGLKQTLDRGQLCCHNAERILVELHWSVMAMAVAELFALKEQLATAERTVFATGDPQRRSLARTMRALRWCLSHLSEIPAQGRDLATLLRLAVTDGYVRRKSRRARYCPKNPDKKPLGDPHVRCMTADERRTLKKHQAQRAAA
jgi:hypothetical protein